LQLTQQEVNQLQQGDEEDVSEEDLRIWEWQECYCKSARSTYIHTP
jgi:hypothetical protein